MKRYWYEWLVMASSAAFSAFGFWMFYSSPAPLPESTLAVVGTVESVTVTRRHSRLNNIRFTVAPGGQRFEYPAYLANAEEASGKLRRGVYVEVRYTRPDDPQLWELRVAGEKLITPDAAYASRRVASYMGLGLGILCAICFSFFLVMHLRRNAP